MPEDSQFPSPLALAEAVAKRMGWALPAPEPPSSVSSSPTAGAVLISRAGAGMLTVRDHGQPGFATYTIVPPRRMPDPFRSALSVPEQMTVPLSEEGVEQFRILYGDFDEQLTAAQIEGEPRAMAASADVFADFSDRLVENLPGTWQVRPVDLQHQSTRHQAMELLWPRRGFNPYDTIGRTLRASRLESDGLQLILLQDAGLGQRLTIAPLRPSWIPAKGKVPLPPPDIPAPAGPKKAADPEAAAVLVAERMLPALARARWVTQISAVEGAAVEVRRAAAAWNAVRNAYSDAGGSDDAGYQAGMAERNREATLAFSAILHQAPGLISGVQAHLPSLCQPSAAVLAGLRGLSRHLQAVSATRKTGWALDPEHTAAAWPDIRSAVEYIPGLVRAAQQVTALVGAPAAHTASRTTTAPHVHATPPPAPPTSGTGHTRGTR